jgi:hypothetical protein
VDTVNYSSPVEAAGVPKSAIPTIENRSESMAESIANGAPIRTHLNTIAAAAIEMTIITGPPYMNRPACQLGKADRLRVSIPTQS